MTLNYIWYDNNGKGYNKKHLICKYCGRAMPNKEHVTKNGCLWCDSEYWQKKQKENDVNQK